RWCADSHGRLLLARAVEPPRALRSRWAERRHPHARSPLAGRARSVVERLSALPRRCYRPRLAPAIPIRGWASVAGPGSAREERRSIRRPFGAGRAPELPRMTILRQGAHCYDYLDSRPDVLHLAHRGHGGPAG